MTDGLLCSFRLVVPLLYLPKSRPEAPPVDELPWAHTDSVLSSDRMSTITLKPTWLPRQDPNAHRREDLPQISVRPTYPPSLLCET